MGAEAYLTEAAQTETESGTAEAVMEEAAPESAAEAVPDASASDARAQVQAMDEPIYSQNTSFIRHIKSALLCLLLGGLAGALWAVLPKY